MTSKQDLDIAIWTEHLLDSLRSASSYISLIEKRETPERRIGWRHVRAIVDTLSMTIDIEQQQQWRSVEQEGE
jgi:hypothetical protein